MGPQISRLVVLLITTAATACGERGVEFHGTIAEGAESRHAFDSSANPVQNPPIPDAKIFAKIGRDHFHQGCSVPATEEPRAISNANGAFDTGLIVWGMSMKDDTLQLCFVKAGFHAHEYHAGNTAPAHETNGEKVMNVILAPE